MRYRSPGVQHSDGSMPLMDAHAGHPPGAKTSHLVGQVRTNQVHGFGQLPGRNANPLPTLRISARIVRGAAFATGTVEGRELRRTDAPVAALLPWHDMEMEVRGLLSAVDAVVLEGEDAEGPVGLDEGFGDPLGRAQYLSALFF